MPKVTLDLGKALTACPAKKGIGPYSLQIQIESYFSSEASKINIKLDSGDTMDFVEHTENDKTVLTSVNSLSSNCNDGVSTENLPKILAKLAEQKVQFTALQFPHAFKVNGRFSSIAYRAHFNHIVIYKDSDDKLNAGIVDSTMNPIGVHNPLPILGWLASNSIFSGEELLQVKLTRLLSQSEARNALQALCDLPAEVTVNTSSSPILTYKQPSTLDKRCAIYTLNGMAAFTNHILTDEKITTASVSETVTAAHQALNEPEMMEISYPVEEQAFSGKQTL
ncbi:hypothetical protein TUM19329_01300 [Legionella antarctica]|uniref:Uncharacterized protein n=1 Tax=Legionella antarctica TaxID=2708020 RepID=A0A6F8T005_9GAMM|nr:hypothetical protein [Legionella antarctica]BCA93769.1 hypothetical protein TUM19329_01300 [Legionella antarctica]